MRRLNALVLALVAAAGLAPAAASPATAVYVIVSRQDEAELANQRALVREHGVLVITSGNRVRDIMEAARRIRARGNTIVVIPYTVCAGRLAPAERADIEETIRTLVALGRLKVFAASGDHGRRCGRYDSGPAYPADVPGVCAIGALSGGRVPAWSGLRPRRNGTEDPDGWDDGVLMRDGIVRLGTSIAVTRAALRGAPKMMRRDADRTTRHNCNLH